jgi:hypothetical protein
MIDTYQQSEKSRAYVEKCISGAWDLYQAVLKLGLPLDRERGILDEILWGISEEGSRGNKYNIRYFTPAALAYQKANPKRIPGVRRSIIHEHVFPRKEIREELSKAYWQTDRRKFEEILRTKVVACVVTREEDKKLSSLGKGASGWDRYAKAGIEVIDGKTGTLLDFDLAMAA